MEKLKDSIFKLLRLDHFVESLSGYLEARVALIKIEIREEVARVVSHGLMVALILLLGLLFLVFFSIGLAVYLNGFFATPFAGYWIVSGLYGVPGLLLILFRKKISHFFEMYLMEQTKRKGK